MTDRPFYASPDEALKALQRFVGAMVTGSREHGAFGRGFRGEWVPSPLFALEVLSDAIDDIAQLQATVTAQQEAYDETLSQAADEVIALRATVTAQAQELARLKEWKDISTSVGVAHYVEQIIELKDTIVAHEESQLSMGRNTHDLAMKLRSMEATIARLEEECLQQRVIGHGDGQQHAIDDVNAGRVDDLIAPRLAQAEAALRDVQAQRDFQQARGDRWLKAFNESEQFQDGPTKRAEKAEAECAVLRQQLSAL